MELELVLNPDDAARLARLPSFVPLRTGTPRTRAVRIIWHDSPDSELADAGLVIAQHGRTWRLERLLPGEAAWPPGAPVPVLAEGNTAGALMPAPPEPLLPVAAFDGRARSFTLNGVYAELTLTQLSGNVRAVASEHRTCRITLAGPDDAVLSLANALTNELRLTVPSASLAAEALAITRGSSPPPRHEAAPELPAGLSVAAAFAYVVGFFTDVILHHAPAAADGRDGPEPVHQMRVAVRRLRSAIKVFHRPMHCEAVAAADTGLKALAARLAPTRDWDVFATETAQAVTAEFPDDKRLQRLMTAAERRRRTAHADLREFLNSADFRRLGISLACLAGGDAWQAPLDEDALATPLDRFAASVLDRRLKRLARAGDDVAALPPAELHAIRLNAKRLRYAAEIFAPLFPGKATHRFIRRLAALQDRLGALNDAAVAASLMQELGAPGYAQGLILGFAGAHSERTRERIERAWRRFHRLAPFWD